LAQDKRHEVIETAISIFSEHGYRATSMNDIAQAVGLSKSTMYHYFSGKQELLVSIYESVLSDNVETARLIAESGGPIDNELREMLVERVVYCCTHAAILRIFFEEEAELPPRLRAKVLEGRRAYQSVMVDLVEQGMKDGLFVSTASATMVVNTFLGAANWTYKWYREDGDRTPRELGEELAGVLMRSIMVAPDVS
jgi:TetR/AcrR family transcriptional regulator, cholesterol catabolism regulator